MDFETRAPSGALVIAQIDPGTCTAFGSIERRKGQYPVLQHDRAPEKQALWPEIGREHMNLLG